MMPMDEGLSGRVAIVTGADVTRGLRVNAIGPGCIRTPLLPWRAVTLHGSCIGFRAELRERVTLVRKQGGFVVPIDRRSLADADAALHDLRAGRVVGRLVLVP